MSLPHILFDAQSQHYNQVLRGFQPQFPGGGEETYFWVAGFLCHILKETESFLPKQIFYSLMRRSLVMHVYHYEYADFWDEQPPTTH